LDPDIPDNGNLDSWFKLVSNKLEWNSLLEKISPPNRDFFNFDDSSLLESNYEPDKAYPNLSTPPADLNGPRLSSHEIFPNEPHGNPHDTRAHHQLEAEYREPEDHYHYWNQQNYLTTHLADVAAHPNYFLCRFFSPLA
jgi:hypothetical protein